MNAEDIEESAEHLILEEVIVKSEHDRIVAAAKRKKDATLALLGNLTKEYRKIVDRNSRLLKSQQIPQEELELDPRITADLNNHLKEEMDLVHKKLAFEVERSRLGLQKLLDHFIEPITCLPFAVSRISWVDDYESPNYLFARTWRFCCRWFQKATHHGPFATRKKTRTRFFNDLRWRCQTHRRKKTGQSVKMKIKKTLLAIFNYPQFSLSQLSSELDERKKIIIKHQKAVLIDQLCRFVIWYLISNEDAGLDEESNKEEYVKKSSFCAFFFLHYFFFYTNWQELLGSAALNYDSTSFF